jgi:hypothetical protein
VSADLERARAAKARLAELLRGEERVVGIGLQRREDGFGLKVDLREAGPEVPAEVDGVPVAVDVVGRITPRGA